ncbi:MAG: hypothetical protein FWD26_07260 [Treponema sp.]|nr:hypothetical protein [Treponema sp.]
MNKAQKIRKIIKSVFFLFFLIAFSMLSCEGDPEFMANIDKEIAWANAARLSVTVSFPPQWGSSPQLGPDRCFDNNKTNENPRLGYDFDVEFSSMPGFGFEKWLAFPTSVYNKLDFSKSSDFVQIDTETETAILPFSYDFVEIDESVSSTGARVATVKILTTEPVTLIPWCGNRPGVFQSNPPLNNTGISYNRNQQIKIWFTTDLIYENGAEIPFGENRILITGQDAFSGELYNNNGDITGYYDKPRYNSNDNTLTIVPVNYSSLGDLIITVTVGTGIIGKNGNGMVSAVNFSYRTNILEVKNVYNAENIWAIHNPAAASITPEDFFFRGAPRERDRRLRTTDPYEVTLYFSVSPSAADMETLPDTIRIAEIEYANILGGEVNAFIRETDFPLTIMEADPNSAGAVYRSLNSSGTAFFKVRYIWNESKPKSGITRLVVLPFRKGSGTLNEVDPATLANATLEGRFVAVVYDDQPPGGTANLYLSGQSSITNNVYNFNAAFDILRVSGNFIQVMDNAGDGIRQMAATMNNPWTMEEQATLKWRLRIVDKNNRDHVALDPSDWYDLNSTERTIDLTEMESSSNVREIQVQYKDSLDKESDWFPSMGDLTYNTSVIQPVSAWSATYYEGGNSINLTWTKPDGADRVEIWVNGMQRDVSDNAAGLTLNNIPAINKSGITSGQPVSNIIEYNISFIAVYPTVRAEAKRVRIWNVPGMSASDLASNPELIEISTAQQLQNINSTGLGNLPATNNHNKKYVLVNNITLTETDFPQGWTPIGTGTTTTTAFYGKFFGNGNTITVNCGFTNATTIGIFGNISASVIRDLTVHYTVDISASSTNTTSTNTGGLVGYALAGSKITNCIVSGSDASFKVRRTATTAVDTRLGGIAGWMQNNVEINNAFVSVNLELEAVKPYVGGAVGDISGTPNPTVGTLILSDIKVISNIICSKTNNSLNSMYIGGIAGNSSSGGGKLMNLSYGGTIKAENTFASNHNPVELGPPSAIYLYCGGIIGYNSFPRLENCVFEKEAKIDIGNANIADRSDYKQIGGIVGNLTGATPVNERSLFNCIARGDINVFSEKGNVSVGGVTGFLHGTNVSSWISLNNCVYEQGSIYVRSNNHTYVGGFIGRAHFYGSFTNCFSQATLITVDNSSRRATTSPVLHFGGFAGHSWEAAILNSGNSSPIIMTDTQDIGEAAVNMGGFIGYIYSTNKRKLENCWSVGSVISQGRNTLITGGLIGSSQGHEIINCWVEGDVFTEKKETTIINPVYLQYRTGGLVGSSSNTNISSSRSSGSVTALRNSPGPLSVGGLVGHASDSGSIKNCYATGNVLVDKTSAGTGEVYAGGLVGYSSINIHNNFASGSVVSQSAGTSSVYAGGLVGYRESGNIQNNAALGASVTAKDLNAMRVAARVYGFPALPPADGSISGNFAKDSMRIENAHYFDTLPPITILEPSVPVMQGTPILQGGVNLYPLVLTGSFTLEPTDSDIPVPIMSGTPVLTITDINNCTISGLSISDGGSGIARTAMTVTRTPTTITAGNPVWTGSAITGISINGLNSTDRNIIYDFRIMDNNENFVLYRVQITPNMANPTLPEHFTITGPELMMVMPLQSITCYLSGNDLNKDMPINNINEISTTMSVWRNPQISAVSPETAVWDGNRISNINLFFLTATTHSLRFSIFASNNNGCRVVYQYQITPNIANPTSIEHYNFTGPTFLRTDASDYMSISGLSVSDPGGGTVSTTMTVTTNYSLIRVGDNEWNGSQITGIDLYSLETDRYIQYDFTLENNIGNRAYYRIEIRRRSSAPNIPTLLEHLYVTEPELVYSQVLSGSTEPHGQAVGDSTFLERGIWTRLPTAANPGLGFSTDEWNFSTVVGRGHPILAWE